MLTQAWSGGLTRAWSGALTQAWSEVLTQAWSGVLTQAWSEGLTRAWSGVLTQAWSGALTVKAKPARRGGHHNRQRLRQQCRKRKGESMKKKYLTGIAVLLAWTAALVTGCETMAAILLSFDGSSQTTQTTQTTQSSREIFNSWIGSHYTKVNGNIPGFVSYSGNSITYDSSWTETKSRYHMRSREVYVSSDGHATTTGQPDKVEYYQIEHKKWVTFYFDADGIITTWRSYGWDT
jgi:hypothetical protein